MSSNPIIETINLSKIYREKVALNSLNLKIYKSCFTILGPNGAGKTTLILLILGLIKPTSGDIFFNEINSLNEAYSYRKKIGYLPENIGFYNEKTGREHVDLVMKLRTEGRLDKKEIDSILEWCGLNKKFWDKKVSTYSQGMLQRLGLALAFLGDINIVLLDEPLSNIDPLGREDLIKKIKIKKEEGITIIISSHIIKEIEELTDYIAILNNGNILITDSYINISKMQGIIEYEIKFEDSLQKSCLETFFKDQQHGNLIKETPIFITEKCIVKTENPNQLGKLIYQSCNLRLRPYIGTLEKIYREIFRREQINE